MGVKFTKTGTFGFGFIEVNWVNNSSSLEAPQVRISGGDPALRYEARMTPVIPHVCMNTEYFQLGVGTVQRRMVWKPASVHQSRLIAHHEGNNRSLKSGMDVN